LNFSAKRSKGATSRRENNPVIKTKPDVDEVTAFSGVPRKANPVMNRAFAGVGRPIKESFLF
jgi:hypothetical protein